MEDKEISHEESLKLINDMIGKVKNNINENGISPILWGSVIVICSLVTYATIKNWFHLPFNIWLLILVALIPQIFLTVKEDKERKVTTYEDAALDYTWMVFGIGIGLLSFIQYAVFKHINTADVAKAVHYSEYSSAYFLLWYGFPGIITGAIKKFKAMLFGSIFCWVAACLVLFTPVDIDMLLMAASAAFAWLIPGILLRKLYLRHRNV